MKRIASIIVAGLAVVSMTACAAPKADPDYLAYIQGQAAIAQHQSEAETSRLHALAAIASTGDDRVKDRAVAELSASANRIGQSSLQAPQYKPSLGLELARIFVPALVQGYGIHSNVKITGINAAAQTEQHGVTMGTIGNVAQGGYNLGAAGIGTAQALGQAGIAKIPSIVVTGPAASAPVEAAPVAADPAPVAVE